MYINDFQEKKALYAAASRSLLDAMTHPHIEDQQHSVSASLDALRRTHRSAEVVSEQRSWGQSHAMTSDALPKGSSATDVTWVGQLRNWVTVTVSTQWSQWVQIIWILLDTSSSGCPPTCPPTYESDHIWPLSICGSGAFATSKVPHLPGISSLTPMDWKDDVSEKEVALEIGQIYGWCSPYTMKIDESWSQSVELGIAFLIFNIFQHLSTSFNIFQLSIGI